MNAHRKTGFGSQRIRRWPKPVRTVQAICLACLVAVVSVGCQSTPEAHPEFAARVKSLTNLVVMPISVMSVQLQPGGPVPAAYPNVEQFSQRLQGQVVNQFESRGVNVVPAKLGENLTVITNGFKAGEPDMAQELRRAYRSLARVGLVARENVVCPEARVLAGHESADALVFTSVYVTTESAGYKTIRWTGNVLFMLTDPVWVEGSPEGCRLQVILVEGRSGEVLWHSRVTPKSLEGARLDAAVAQAFARYPKP